MINFILTLISSPFRKAMAGAIVAGLLFGAWQIHGCQQAKRELREYKAAVKIRQQDRKTDKQIEENKNEVDSYTSDADLEHGFDKLRSYGR